MLRLAVTTGEAVTGIDDRNVGLLVTIRHAPRMTPVPA